MVAEGYKNTEIGVVPAEWYVVRLEDIAKKLQSGGTPLSTNSDFYDGDIPFVKIDDITRSGKYLLNTKVTITQKGLNSSSAWLVPVNSILYSMYASIGFLSINKVEVSTNQAIMNIIPDSSKITLEFLYQYLLDLKGKIDKFIDQTTQKNLNAKKVKNFKIPLPPLKEQEKIADILSTADDKIDTLTTQIKKVETLKRALLQKLLSEGIGHSKFKDCELGKIPENWEVGKLEDISDFITKGATPTTYGFNWEETGIPFLRSECVSDNGLDMKAAMFISDEAHRYMNRSEIKNGDLLMTITGNVGRVILLQDTFIIGNINQHIARIRITSKHVDNKFIYQYLSQDQYRLNYYKITTGQAYPQISLKQVRNSIVPLPPLEEQKQIADILLTADEKLEVLRAKKEKYITLKKGLMQKLLTGELRTV